MIIYVRWVLNSFFIMKNFITKSLLSIMICTAFNTGNNLQATESIMTFGEFRKSEKINDKDWYWQLIEGIKISDNFKYSCYVIEHCSNFLMENYSGDFAVFIKGFLYNLNLIISLVKNEEDYIEKEKMLDRMYKVFFNDWNELTDSSIDEMRKKFSIDESISNEKIKNIAETVFDHSRIILDSLREQFL